MNRITKNTETGKFLLKKESELCGVVATLGEFDTEAEAIAASTEPVSTQRYATGAKARNDYEAWLKSFR